jgi:hypothetical protein
LNNDRFFEMNFFEFLEVFARIAERASFFWIERTEKNDKSNRTEREAQPLQLKIEALII